MDAKEDLSVLYYVIPEVLADVILFECNHYAV
jgi:hypothetical protein